MKKVLILAMCLTMCAGAAMAGHIGLYADKTVYSLCFKVYNPVAQNAVYVVQKFNTGSSGCEFKVNNTSGAILDNAAVTSGFIGIGDPETGISVAYQACVNTPSILIMTLRYYDANEIVEPSVCGKLEVIENPGAVPPVRQIADCNSNLFPVSGGSFYWGGVGACPGCAEPTATERTTWGGVKALYR